MRKLHEIPLERVPFPPFTFEFLQKLRYIYRHWDSYLSPNTYGALRIFFYRDSKQVRIRRVRHDGQLDQIASPSTYSIQWMMPMTEEEVLADPRIQIVYK